MKRFLPLRVLAFVSASVKSEDVSSSLSVVLVRDAASSSVRLSERLSVPRRLLVAVEAVRLVAPARRVARERSGGRGSSGILLPARWRPPAAIVLRKPGAAAVAAGGSPPAVGVRGGTPSVRGATRSHWRIERGREEGRGEGEEMRGEGEEAVVMTTPMWVSVSVSGGKSSAEKKKKSLRKKTSYDKNQNQFSLKNKDKFTSLK